MKNTLAFAVCLLAASLAPSSLAQAVDMTALVAQLRQGGYVIVMRHGATHRDQADTDPLNLGDVSKQRQLNDEGRDLARKVGDAWRKLGVPIGTVVTSRFARAVETGTLITGGSGVATDDVSEGGLVVTPIENDRRAAALRRLAGTRPGPGRNTLIVTHKPNILDAFGRDWFDVKEGEASVFKPDDSGKWLLVAKVQPTDWIDAVR